MRRFALVMSISVSLVLQGCASIQYNCEETCALSGMVCKGETFGSTSTGGVAYSFNPDSQPVFYNGSSNQVSYQCEYPTTEAQKGNMGPALESANNKAIENQKRKESGTVIAIVLIVVGVVVSALAISSAKNSMDQNFRYVH